jgi:hypothetical protein
VSETREPVEAIKESLASAVWLRSEAAKMHAEPALAYWRGRVHGLRVALECLGHKQPPDSE